MGKKFMNTVLFLAVTVAAATLTAYVGKGSGNVLLYNFTFLGLMLITFLSHWYSHIPAAPAFLWFYLPDALWSVPF